MRWLYQLYTVCALNLGNLKARLDSSLVAVIGFTGVIMVWLFATCAHQLGSTEQGVVTTFGKYTETIGPGPNFTAPWPIQTSWPMWT